MYFLCRTNATLFFCVEQMQHYLFCVEQMQHYFFCVEQMQHYLFCVGQMQHLWGFSVEQVKQHLSFCLTNATALKSVDQVQQPPGFFYQVQQQLIFCRTNAPPECRTNATLKFWVSNKCSGMNFIVEQVPHCPNTVEHLQHFLSNKCNS